MQTAPSDLTDRHPNAELLRRTVRAAAAGAVERLRELCAEDVVVHHAGEALGGEDALSQLVSLARSGTEFHDVLANDEHGVVLRQLHASRQTVVCHFRKGRITELWLL